jgi:hypothetical protein
VSRLVRDELEIGLEREYALYAWHGDTVAYLLANDRLRLPDAPPGWRIAPEYSRCLVEIASPPVTRENWPALLAGFAALEAALARAAALLTKDSRFDRIECTADYSVRTDRYVTLDGAPVTTFRALLLDGAHDNWLLGTSTPPACLGHAELAYAGFTSTHATIHPQHASPDYVWRLLRTAREIETRSPQRHPMLREGRTPIPPDERSIRDALVRWGDPATAALLDDVPATGDVARFTAASYSCRTRLVEGTMLYEIRCFHSGLPLAELAPLLDV